MSIAVYTRISTKDQKADSQRAEIKAWLKSHGHDLQKVTWYEDQESGATTKRVKFQALNKAIFDGQVKTVVVWKLDRLARSIREGINTISDWCEKGVRIVSVTQQLDLSGSVGHMVAGVLFGIAEIELGQIKERQAAGIAEAKKNGVYKGRKSGTRKGDPARAKELKNQGFKKKEIANALGVSISTVSNYLRA